MFLNFIVAITIGVAVTAELIPWNTTSCEPVTTSCRRTEQTKSRDCEYICNGTQCQINVAIIFPADDFFIVNQNRAVKELKSAIRHAQRENLIPENLKIKWQLFDDKCDQAYATIATIDAYSEYCAHVVFGPICDYCLASAGRIVKFLNSYGTPLITPGGFSFDFVVKKTECSDEFFMLINTGMVDYQSLAEFFYLLLMKYQWRRFALLYEKYDQNEVGGDQGCQLLMKSIIETAKTVKDFHFIDGDISLLNITYEKYLEQEVGVKYGIIPICASHKNTRKILIEAEKIRMTQTGEYVFLNFELYNNASIPSRPWYDANDTDENNEMARRAYRSLLTFTPWIEGEYAERNQTVDERRGMIYLDGIYDGFLLYSHVINEILFPNSTDTSIIPQETKLKGVDVISRMYGYEFKGKREKIMINCNGQRVAKYALMQMNGEDGFHIVAEYNTLDKKIRMKRHVTWVSSQKPGDTPLCGYNNSKCPTESRLHIYIITATVIPVVAIIFVLLILYRHKKREAEIASMTWKINCNEIDFRDRFRPSYHSSNGSLAKIGSQMTLFTLDGSLAGDRQLYTTVALYKKSRVAVKRLKNIKIELTREQLIELKEMKDLSNDHLVKFYGVCLDHSFGCILTEYCQKGSLQDLLEKDEVNLDFMFRLSLMQDVVSGMQYLHNSDIKYHGSLKSTNCMVDRRFAVKITDFGVRFLRRHVQDDFSSSEGSKEELHSHWERQLWTAPELLRGQKLCPNEMQKADVYSFAIIIHEIVVRKGVFYLGDDYKMTKKEIVETVKKGLDAGSQQPLRPHIDEHTDDDVGALVQKCWAEDAANRPDFDAMKDTIRKINRSNGNDLNLLDNLLARMEQYASNLEVLVDERTFDYLEEKRKCEELLYQLLPKSVAIQLITGKSVIAETFDQVTIYFSDIVGFTTLSAMSTPLEVVDLLNDLYTCFDSIIEEFDVYKVETIGDAYMVVSGLPEKNGTKHACEIARMSLALLVEVRKFKIRHRPEEPLQLRIGMHTGPCVAGVVGLKMPRYCLFGDTVNTASRMESNGQPFKIHVSAATKKILDTYKTFDLECRGEVEIKGKGRMTTYWLKGERKPVAATMNTITPTTTTTVTPPRREITFSNNGKSDDLNHEREETIPLLSIRIPDNHSQV